MKLVFLDPAGAWAFLGVPALVLIHCLRVRAREVRIPAIFLVERRDEAAPGRRFAKWRGSPLFWIQLLAILLLATLLMRPRIVAPESRREVALVVDASVSMRAFPKETAAAAGRLADLMSRDVATTHWLLMSTDESAPPIYVGDDRAAMLAALGRFSPELGTHDFTAALLAARRGVVASGRVVLLTDRDLPEIPAGAELVAVGHPLDNAGFSGGECGVDRRWRAMLANPSDKPATRRWHLESTGDARTPDTSVVIPARGTIAIGGVAPADRFTVVLDADAFPVDDRLPLVVTAPKPLLWRLALPPGMSEPVRPALLSLDAAREAADADIEILSAKSRDLPAKARARILFLDSTGDKVSPGREPCYAPAKHPLTDGLAWSIAPAFSDKPLGARPGDTVLVRSCDRPVVILGESSGVRELVFDYDPREVFAGARSPAVAVLIRRFAEAVRETKNARQALNTDCLTTLPAVAGDGPPVIRDAKGEHVLAAGVAPRAPGLPGHFELLRGGETKLSGAAMFADAREADFTRAESLDRLASPDANAVKGESETDPLTLAALLALLALSLLAWRVSATRHAE